MLVSGRVDKHYVLRDLRPDSLTDSVVDTGREAFFDLSEQEHDVRRRFRAVS